MFNELLSERNRWAPDTDPHLSCALAAC